MIRTNATVNALSNATANYLQPKLIASSPSQFYITPPSKGSVLCSGYIACTAQNDLKRAAYPFSAFPAQAGIFTGFKTPAFAGEAKIMIILFQTDYSSGYDHVTAGRVRTQGGGP